LNAFLDPNEDLVEIASLQGLLGCFDDGSIKPIAMGRCSRQSSQ
jgi:hypothetical protein